MSDRKLALMIIESVACLVLHCSRCNAAFQEDADDGYDCAWHWESTKAITDAFRNGIGGYGGWRRVGDRIVCGNCWEDDVDGEPAEKPPLPAAEADKVARAQAAYLNAERHIVALTDDGWTIKHPLSCRPRLFDCPVNKAAERDLTEPPVELGRFVCGIDDQGHFAILQTKEITDE